LYSGTTLVGIAEKNIPTYYRHFLIGNTHTLNIALTGFKGNPYVMAKVSNIRVKGDAVNAATYNWIA
jgi:hypothetical protein